MGIRLDFQNSTTNEDELEWVKFSTLDISTNQQLEKTLTKTTRIINAIRSLGGRATPSQIAQVIGMPDDTHNISMICSKSKDKFVAIERGVYGLLQKE